MRANTHTERERFIFWLGPSVKTPPLREELDRELIGATASF